MTSAEPTSIGESDDRPRGVMSQTTVFERDLLPSEQFEDLQQQSYAATLGMWAFLATEVLFIGVIFVGFYIYRLHAPEAFAAGARELAWPLGTLNTAVLLGSSFTMALAVHAARAGEQRSLLRRLCFTLVLGSAFLAIKAIEYGIEYHERLVPGLRYDAIDSHGEPRPAAMGLFMAFYFVLTGIHAIHMIVGVGVLSVVALLAHRGKFDETYHNPVEIAGLYWHFVDLVWVFVFPTLYLLRHA